MNDTRRQPVRGLSACEHSGQDFAGLLVQNDRGILRYIMTFVPQQVEAEEILQRVALFLWENFDQYTEADRKGSFLAWATRVAYFEVLNYRKEAARRRFVFSEKTIEVLAETRQEESELLEAQLNVLRRCLNRLDRDSKRILHRYYCDAETVPHLSTELGRSAKSLYRQLDRLRERVALCVEQQLKTMGMS